jgi:hypothetical protein
MCEVRAEELEEVPYSGAGEASDRSAVGGAHDGGVMYCGVGVDGEFAGGEHVEVGVDRVVVECDEGVRPWEGSRIG